MILTETKNSSKGMKIEWATIKDDVLWVGSFGKEYIGKKYFLVNIEILFCIL
jgi:hypothetical protein